MHVCFIILSAKEGLAIRAVIIASTQVLFSKFYSLILLKMADFRQGWKFSAVSQITGCVRK